MLLRGEVRGATELRHGFSEPSNGLCCILVVDTFFGSLGIEQHIALQSFDHQSHYSFQIHLDWMTTGSAILFRALATCH